MQSTKELDLPTFLYHPDPIITGSVKPSEVMCRACSQIRGFIYTGPVYAEQELVEAFCPWCIADGSAHAKFSAEFTDQAGIGGYGDWDSVPQSVADEITFQTPAFSGWQQERWWTHCHDGAEFLGVVGQRELQAWGRSAVTAIAEQTDLMGNELQHFLQSLDTRRGPTAYLFRCHHGGRFGGYVDHA